MSKRNLLPTAPEIKGKSAVNIITPKARENWNESIKASDDGDNVINILDSIGYDWWADSGTTAKRISGALKSIGQHQDVIVNINSPGGDVFEGLAIYNLLREHKGKVTVRVLGIAASAASFIAMAADEIQIARAGFLMIHNAWTVVSGDKSDLTEVVNFLEQIDETIADIYHIRSGLDINELSTQMNAETWITGKTAVDTGMADSFLDNDVTIEDKNTKRNSAQKIDRMMAMNGVSSSERQKIINDLRATQHTEIPKETIKSLEELSNALADFQA